MENYVLIAALLLLVVVIVLRIKSATEKRRKRKAEAFAKEEKRREREQKCREKYNLMKAEVMKVYNRDAHVKWGNLHKGSTISKLTSMRFYFEEETNLSYLSINVDNSGRKALYRENNGKYDQIRIEDADDFHRTLVVTVGLASEPPMPDAIHSFNDMERIMSELGSMPYISFRYSGK